MKTKPWMMLVAMMAGWINRQQQDALAYLTEENKIFKHELLKATGKKRIFLNDKQRRRLAILAKRVGRKALFGISGVFSPDTLMLWYRKLVAQKYDGSKNRGKGGRPRISDYLRQLIIDMAKDNKHLGGKTLHGHLKYLGLKVSPSTINRILREHGIEPNPDRPVKTTAASPNLNPFVERFIRSIKHECLNKMLIFGESHLRYVTSEYISHYHTGRPHQGIGNNIITAQRW